MHLVSFSEDLLGVAEVVVLIGSSTSKGSDRDNRSWLRFRIRFPIRSMGWEPHGEHQPAKQCGVFGTRSNVRVSVDLCVGWNFRPCGQRLEPYRDGDAKVLVGIVVHRAPATDCCKVVPKINRQDSSDKKIRRGTFAHSLLSI